MGEKFNFICIGDRRLPARECRANVEPLLLRLTEWSFTPTELMRIHTDSFTETTVPFSTSDSLVEAELTEDELLTAFFFDSRNSASGKQSLTFELKEEFSVATVSLDPSLFDPKVSSHFSVLTAIANWALEIFGVAALGCGPELDLYESDGIHELREIPEAFLKDWRCLASILIVRSYSHDGSSRKP